MRVAVIACLAAPALGFIGAPVPLARRDNALQAEREDDSTKMHIQSYSRADALQTLGGIATGVAAFGGLLPALAEGEAPAVDLSAAPASFDLTKEYYKDAAQMLNHMKYATYMNRDTPNYENIAKSVKGEMTDFVSYYRRFNNVAGKPSFSTLYTAINVMAGHYASYGPKFPIPEKRRKRLQQEFTEIERNIKRNR